MAINIKEVEFVVRGMKQRRKLLKFLLPAKVDKREREREIIAFPHQLPDNTHESWKFCKGISSHSLIFLLNLI